MLPGKKFTPEDLLRIAWHRKWLIVVPFLVVGITTALIAWRLPDRYEADTLILVVPQRVPDNYVKPTVTTTIEDRLQSTSQQILSRSRLERLIVDLGLYPKERKTWIMQDIVEKMQRDVKVQVVQKAEAFRVSFTYEDRRLAVDVVNKLAAAFIDESNQDRTLFAESTTSFLETEKEEARRRLDELDRRLAEYRMKHAGELPTEREANLQVLSSTQLQVQNLVEAINRDRDRRYMLERQLTDLTADAPVPAAAPVASGDAGTLTGQTVTEQLEAARAGLRTLELRFKPDHPDVRRMKRIIADLEAKAQAEALQKPVSPEAGGRPASPAEAQRQARIRDLRLEIEAIDRGIATKQAEEKQLQGRIGEYNRRVEATPARESELTSLLRDYDTVQKHYASLLAKQEDSKIAANLEHRQIGEQFRTVDQARMPERPVSPNRPLIDLVGALVGLGLGVGLVGFLEYRDNSFRTDDEIVRVLALPVLAVVPTMLSRSERRQQRRRATIAATATAVVAVCVMAGAVWFFLLRGGV